MDNFLTCFCDEDYTALIIEGEAPEEELYEAWIVLLNEYHEINETPEAMEHASLRAQITRLRSNLELTQAALDFLNARWSESVAQDLRRLGHQFRPASTDPEEYRPLLVQVAARARSKFVQLQQLIKELGEKNQAIVDKNEKPKRSHFENLLAYIEEMQGTSYSMEAIPVSKFITLEKKYWAKIEALEKQKAMAHG